MANFVSLTLCLLAEVLFNTALNKYQTDDFHSFPMSQKSKKW